MKAPKNLLKLVGLALQRPSDVAWFIGAYRQWQRRATSEWKASFAELKPCLKDRHDSAGSARGHYFVQDVWAAQRVFLSPASEHIDVASRIDGFVAHVISFKPVRYVDIRPLITSVPNLSWVEGTVCALPFADKSVSSLSCLHVIEHIGLGRYGDPLDPDGWRVALAELARVLAPGGELLIGTPCGRPRVVFHAHRIFDPQQIVDALPNLRLVEFSVIRDNRAVGWEANVPLTAAAGLDYGCGLFRFTR